MFDCVLSGSVWLTAGRVIVEGKGAPRQDTSALYEPKDSELLEYCLINLSFRPKQTASPLPFHLGFHTLSEHFHLRRFSNTCPLLPSEVLQSFHRQSNGLRYSQ